MNRRPAVPGVNALSRDGGGRHRLRVGGFPAADVDGLVSQDADRHAAWATRGGAPDAAPWASSPIDQLQRLP